MSRMPLTTSPNPARDAAYYQDIHEHHPAYQTNNWLVDEIDRIAAFGAESVLELACGNGRFLELAASRFRHVYACDWAVAPRIEHILAAHPNVRFFRTDLYVERPPCQAGLVVSADFLEHIAPESLADVIHRIDAMAPMAFHKIACYDDGHSHLSVLPPHAWLDLFRSIAPGYQLERVTDRHDDPARTVAVIVKGRRA
jgi:SAM-dependent methyltransferase